MITLAFTYYVLAYLLIPAALFRWFASAFVTLRNFQRSKSQEFAFAVGTAILPFLAACLLIYSGRWIWAFAVQTGWEQRWADYKLLYQTLADKFPVTDKGISDFWIAVGRVWRRQVDFLSCYYFLTLLEAGVFAILVHAYPVLRSNKTYSYLARKLVLPHLSEWTLLLTPFNFKNQPSREIWLDILSSDGVLYRGLLGQFFLDTNGSLTGLVLWPLEEDSAGNSPRKPLSVRARCVSTAMPTRKQRTLTQIQNRMAFGVLFRAEPFTFPRTRLLI